MTVRLIAAAHRPADFHELMKPILSANADLVLGLTHDRGEATTSLLLLALCRQQLLPFVAAIPVPAWIRCANWSMQPKVLSLATGKDRGRALIEKCMAARPSFSEEEESTSVVPECNLWKD
jgi:hypothetical protein